MPLANSTTGSARLQVMIEGLLSREPFLGLVRDFIVFEDEGGGRQASPITKVMSLRPIARHRA